MRVTVVDSGMGNLHSVVKALRYVGAEVEIATRMAEVILAERLVLPGVGAFAANVRALMARGLWTATGRYLRLGRPFLGICVGMQLLLDESEEFGSHKGFGVIPGRVVALKGPKVPHVGWNALYGWSWVQPGAQVYFTHSYAAIPDKATDSAAVTSYGGETITAAVRCGNVLGTQFHPEKSGEVGLAILKRWVNE